MSGDLSNIVQGASGTMNVSSIDLDAQNNVTIDAETGKVSIEGNDDSDFTVSTAAKDLDLAVTGGGTQELRLASAGTGASALHLNASAGGINIDSADMIDIDAADEITIDTTSVDGHIAITSAHIAGQSILISANANAGSILDMDAGIVTVDAQAGISLDAATDSNLTVTGSGQDLDIAVVGAGTQELRLASAGTGTNAIHLNASAGGINMDSAGVIELDAGGDITLDAGGGDVVFKVAETTYSHFENSSGLLAGIATPAVATLNEAASKYTALIYNNSTKKIHRTTFAQVCFLKGTKITLPNHKQKNIEDLTLEDEVLTYNIQELSEIRNKNLVSKWQKEDMKGELSKSGIRNIWINPTDSYLVINDKLKVTKHHLIHFKRDNRYYFNFAEILIEGDELMTDTGSYDKIETIEEIQDNINVYNFELDKDQTYFAENYLVHHYCKLCSGYANII